MRNLLFIIYLSSFIFLGNTIFAEDTMEEDIAIASKLSKAFSRVAEKTFPSVVVIENLQTKNSRQLQKLPPEWEEFFGKPMQRPQRSEGDRKPFPVGFGSGIIIRDNGYIVTNNHVIEGAEFLRVKLKDGTVYDNYLNKESVKIIGVDEKSDIVVLKINDEKKTFKALTFANSDEVLVGEWAIAIGAPFNYDYTFTVGVVSQKGRHNVFKNRIVESYIQTDASINPGNSGGPLLSIKGEVMGINNFIANGGGIAASAGLGFAISSNIVKNVSDQIIIGGKVNRPWLGIQMLDLTVEDRKNFNIEKGVLLKEVLKDNPAEKAGLLSGDVILKVGKVDCNTAYDVQATVLSYKPGEVIEMTINRNQKDMIFKITSTLRDAQTENNVINKVEPSVQSLGLNIKEVDSALEIQTVEEDSEAFQKGIKPGMRILSINRIAVKTINEFNKILKEYKGEAIMLKLNYQNKDFIEFIKVR